MDVTSQYYSYGIDEAYELNSISKTENMFETNKDYFEGRAGSSRITSSYGLGDYDVYSLTSNGDYMYLCRIDNTLLYIDVDDRYKEEVKEIIDELDY